METLFQLRKIFPMPSLTNGDPSSVNSDYSNGGRNLKNGYYAFGCYGSEDIWYSHMAGSSKEVMDSSFVYKSDHIYNGFHTDNSYKSSFIYFSKDCADSIFLFDCRNRSAFLIPTMFRLVVSYLPLHELILNKIKVKCTLDFSNNFKLSSTLY